MGRLSISVDDTLINRIEYFLSKNKDYDGVSDLVQRLLRSFFETSSKEQFKFFMVYLGYPLIIMTILLKLAAVTHDVLYNYLNSLIIGLLLAGLYLFIRKYRGKK